MEHRERGKWGYGFTSVYGLLGREGIAGIFVLIDNYHFNLSEPGSFAGSTVGGFSY